MIGVNNYYWYTTLQKSYRSARKSLQYEIMTIYGGFLVFYSSLTFHGF